MDFTTIIIIVAVVAILFFLWPRVSRRRNVPSNLNPPGVSDEGFVVPPGDRMTRTDVTPQAERPAGQAFPSASTNEGDVVDEAMDDVRSQNPNKSL
jgi:hypothetical protein